MTHAHWWPLVGLLQRLYSGPLPSLFCCCSLEAIVSTSCNLLSAILQGRNGNSSMDSHVRSLFVLHLSLFLFRLLLHHWHHPHFLLCLHLLNVLLKSQLQHRPALLLGCLSIHALPSMLLFWLWVCLDVKWPSSLSNPRDALFCPSSPPRCLACLFLLGSSQCHILNLINVKKYNNEKQTKQNTTTNSNNRNEIQEIPILLMRMPIWMKMVPDSIRWNHCAAPQMDDSWRHPCIPADWWLYSCKKTLESTGIRCHWRTTTIARCWRCALTPPLPFLPAPTCARI